MYSRNLVSDYPSTDLKYTKFFDIKYIQYFPYDIEYYNIHINKIYKYAILSSVRTLTKSENSELCNLVNVFQSGKLTKSKKIIHFKNGTQTIIYSNKNQKSDNIHFSDQYKKLHWGQRKLLISEIDFLNRVNECEAFYNSKELNSIPKNKVKTFNVIYPGSAPGYKLFFLLLLFPHTTFYLWDPAKFDIILYISDFLRRSISLNELNNNGIYFSKYQLESAHQIKNRVYINPDLDNADYLIYFRNAISKKFNRNYKDKYGFFSR